MVLCTTPVPPPTHIPPRAILSAIILSRSVPARYRTIGRTNRRPRFKTPTTLPINELTIPCFIRKDVFFGTADDKMKSTPPVTSLMFTRIRRIVLTDSWYTTFDMTKKKNKKSLTFSSPWTWQRSRSNLITNRKSWGTISKAKKRRTGGTEGITNSAALGYCFTNWNKPRMPSLARMFPNSSRSPSACIRNEGSDQMIVIAVTTPNETYFLNRFVYIVIKMRFQAIEWGSGARQISHVPVSGHIGAVTAHFVVTCERKTTNAAWEAGAQLPMSPSRSSINLLRTSISSWTEAPSRPISLEIDLDMLVDTRLRVVDGDTPGFALISEVSCWLVIRGTDCRWMHKRWIGGMFLWRHSVVVDTE